MYKHPYLFLVYISYMILQLPERKEKMSIWKYFDNLKEYDSDFKSNLILDKSLTDWTFFVNHEQDALKIHPKIRCWWPTIQNKYSNIVQISRFNVLCNVQSQPLSFDAYAKN